MSAVALAGEACHDRAAEGAARDDILRFCGLLHDKGFLAANDGNVSVRLCPRHLLITPTGVPKAFLRPSDMALVDFEGRSITGPKPSGEISMHLAALAARPECNAVVHAHPPSCIAMSLHKHLKVNGILPEVILSLGQIEVVPYARPLSAELAKGAAAALAHTDGVVLERHGTVSVGKSVLEAYTHTERLEHAAQVLWMAHALGRPVPLPEREAHDLKELYDRARAAKTR